MTIAINGNPIDAGRIDYEARNHLHEADPHACAAYALAIRELLLQRARSLGIAGARGGEGEAEEGAIETLLAAEAPVPEPDESECRRHYAANIERYSSGALVEAAHILFAVTPNATVDAIRRQAEATLREARVQPERFAELARTLSNCPSGAQGGSLGQLRRGDVVPELERVLFAAAPGVLPRLAQSRYGFHVVRITHTLPAQPLDFALVHAEIRAGLTERVRMKAAEQYVRMLAAQAAVTGIDLGAAASPLLR
jgi:peptidyl-prolyl cis-trans isomerase C